MIAEELVASDGAQVPDANVQMERPQAAGVPKLRVSVSVPCCECPGLSAL